MKERPILFNGAMVRAILEGRKTQTRRIVKPSIVQHIEFMGGNGEEPPEFEFVGLKYGQWRTEHGKEMPPQWLVYCTEYPEEGVVTIGQLYGAIGDRLWVRETWQGPLLDSEEQRAHFSESPDTFKKPGFCVYRATDTLDAIDDDGNEIGWRPSIHMPRWASRINLEVTGVRVERLKDISEVDAASEGVVQEILPPTQTSMWRMSAGQGNWHSHAAGAYRELWKSINGPDSWDANPWVWVIEFKRIEA